MIAFMALALFAAAGLAVSRVAIRERAAVGRVRVLHVAERGWCWSCECEWPCPTDLATRRRAR